MERTIIAGFNSRRGDVFVQPTAPLTPSERVRPVPAPRSRPARSKPKGWKARSNSPSISTATIRRGYPRPAELGCEGIRTK